MDISTILIVVGVIALFALEAIFEVAITSVFGASVRWILNNKKQSFKELYSSKIKLNYIIGLITVLILSIIILGSFAIINN